MFILMRDVVDKPSDECGANLYLCSVGRVGTDKFGCRLIRRPFVGVVSNEKAVLRVAGRAKTVSQPVLPENKTEELRNWSRAPESTWPVISCRRSCGHFIGVSLYIKNLCCCSCSRVVCTCASVTDRGLECVIKPLDETQEPVACQET